MASDQKPLALIPQATDTASAAGPPGPSREEVQQRIDNLYQRVETATENYNATRVMAARERQRPGSGGEAAKRTQWLDTAREKLGPSLAAVLPADRLPGRSGGQGRPAGRPVDRQRESSIEKTVAELVAATQKGRREQETPALGTGREPRALGPGRETPALPPARGLASPSAPQRSLRTSKEGIQRKLATARELLTLRTARQRTPLAALESPRWQAPWPTAERDTTAAQEWPSATRNRPPRQPGTPDTGTYPTAVGTGTYPEAGGTGGFRTVHGTGTYPTAGDTGPFPAAGGTGSFPAIGSTGSYPAVDSTGSYPAATATGSLPTVHDTGSYPAATATGSLPTIDNTGSYPAATATGAFPPAAAPSATGAGRNPAATGTLPVSGDATGAGKAEIAAAFARAQTGKPYVWGATGPGSYDNAGLVQAAWKAAGFGLPRTAAEQARYGPAVSLAAARPGDLVFFYDDLSHVGIYTGNGMMVHAPRPGAYVREESVYFDGEAAIRGAIRLA